MRESWFQTICISLGAGSNCTCCVTKPCDSRLWHLRWLTKKKWSRKKISRIFCVVFFCSKIFCVGLFLLSFFSAQLFLGEPPPMPYRLGHDNICQVHYQTDNYSHLQKIKNLVFPSLFCIYAVYSIT